MIGGNDLVNGCKDSKLADRMRTLAQEILREEAERVVIPSLRPRSDVAYNALACQYASPKGKNLTKVHHKAQPLGQITVNISLPEEIQV